MVYVVDFPFLLCLICLVILLSCFHRFRISKSLGGHLFLRFQRPTNSACSMSLFLSHFSFQTPSLLSSSLIMFHVLRNKNLQASFHNIWLSPGVTSRDTNVHSPPHIHSAFPPRVFICIFLVPNIYKQYLTFFAVKTR